MGLLNFLVHYEENGFIRNCVYEPGEDYITMCKEQNMPHAVFDGSPPDNVHMGHYYDASLGAIVPRPHLPVTVNKMEILADDQDVATITGLPDPVTIKVDGVEHVVTGGTLSITSPMPAVYKIEIEHWPYLEWSGEIVAS